MRLRLPKAVLATLTAASSACSAATVPFSDDFESYGTGNVTVGQFVESSPALYTIVADSLFADQNYQAIIASNSGGLSASAAVAFPGLAGSDFGVSTTFRIDSFTTTSGSTINLGLGALGTDPHFSNGNQYRILFTVFSPTVAEHGTINIQENGTTFASQIRGASIGVALDVDYTLTLSGTYIGSSLALTATATRLDTQASTTTTVTDTTPPSGQHFGYRTAVNAVGGAVSEDVEYDNFSVVPEPASGALLAATAALLTVPRRRKSANI
jgi:hypothetical protein